jgi:hypothetical protein
LGLGVTPKTIDLGKSFEIGAAGSGLLSTGSTTDIRMMSNVYYNNGYKFAGTGRAAVFLINAGEFIWQQSTASGTVGNAVTSSNTMTLDASGNLLVGTTSVINRGVISLKFAGGATTNGITTQPSVNQFYNPAVFQNFSGSDTGYIQVNAGGTATTFGTSSDYRLKNNIAPMTGALEKVALLKPCTYKWNADGSDGQGFIAHELQAIIPDAVIGEKDAVYADGKIKPQGIDTSFLVATLTAAIQELNAKFEEYKAAHP